MGTAARGHKGRGTGRLLPPAARRKRLSVMARSQSRVVVGFGAACPEGEGSGFRTPALQAQEVLVAELVRREVRGATTPPGLPPRCRWRHVDAARVEVAVARQQLAACALRVVPLLPTERKGRCKNGLTRCCARVAAFVLVWRESPSPGGCARLVPPTKSVSQRVRLWNAFIRPAARHRTRPAARTCKRGTLANTAAKKKGRAMAPRRVCVCGGGLVVD